VSAQFGTSTVSAHPKTVFIAAALSSKANPTDIAHHEDITPFLDIGICLAGEGYLLANAHHFSSAANLSIASDNSLTTHSRTLC
jgi:hypothetical protein